MANEDDEEMEPALRQGAAASGSASAESTWADILKTGSKLKLGDNSPRGGKGLRASLSPVRTTAKEHLKRGAAAAPASAPKSPRLLAVPAGAPAAAPSAGAEDGGVKSKVRSLEDRIARIEGTLVATQNQVNDIANSTVQVKSALEANTKQSEEVAELLRALKAGAGIPGVAPSPMEQG